MEAAAAPRASAAEVAVPTRDAVAALVARLPSGFFEAILPPGTLDPAQEARLAEIDVALRAEYSLRRRMLTERAKVTLQSFTWSTRLEEEGAAGAAGTLRDAALAQMQADPQVALADVAQATLGEVLAVTERATSGGLPTRVKDVLIGSVPDRGGRTEGRSRAADMPAWSVRTVSGRGAGKRGGGGRGGGGGPRKKGK